MWPSRGLELLGFEIKASRADWLRELANPAKAEPIAGYCDKWWIVAEVGCVRPDELPPLWGLMEYNSLGSIRKVVEPPVRQDVKPLDRSFVAAMMRRVGEMGEAEIKQRVKSAVSGLQERWREDANREVEERTKRCQGTLDALKRVQEQTGLALLNNLRFRENEFILAVKFAMQAQGLLGPYSRLKSVRSSLKSLIQEIDALAPLVNESEGADKN
jgi:hypothetical protein